MSDAYTAEYRAIAHKVAEKSVSNLTKVFTLVCQVHVTKHLLKFVPSKLLVRMLWYVNCSRSYRCSSLRLESLGISAITNHAAGFQSSLNHEEVVAVTQQIKEDFKTLVKSVLQNYN